MDRKKKIVERYLKQLRHHRTHEEEKAIQRAARERKAGWPARGRRREGDRDDAEGEAAEFERIERAKPFRPAAPRGASGAPHAGLEPEAGALPPAIVLTVARGRVQVSLAGDGGGEVAWAAGGGEFAAGDELDVERLADGSLRVRAVRSRRTVLSRPDPANPRRERVIAANVDRVAIVVAVREPEFRARLVDRYLVAVGRGGAVPIVCANKADLLGRAERDAIAPELEAWRAAGVACHFTSSSTGEGLPALRAELAGRTAVFVGQSGVGKSSLLNALAPGLDLRTSAVRASDGKGRHTTTASTLIELDGGTRVIDTPGVRAFGLHDIAPRELAAYFPEFAGLDCRFGDCQHDREPGCGVRAATDGGEVPRRRYEAYLRILSSLDGPTAMA